MKGGWLELQGAGGYAAARRPTGPGLVSGDMCSCVLELKVMVEWLVHLQWQPLGVAGRVHQAAHTAFCVFVRAFTGGGGDGPASTRARGSVVDVPVACSPLAAVCCVAA